MNKYQEALDYAKKHLDSKQDLEKVEVLQELVDKSTLLKSKKVNEWIPIEERLPEEYTCIDDETGYYKRSDEVLCFHKSDYNDYEYWIDFTIDGEWQCSDYYVGDKMYWMPLPEPYKGSDEDENTH